MGLMGLLDVAFIEYNNGSTDVSRAEQRRLTRAYVARKSHERRRAEDGQQRGSHCLGNSLQIDATNTTQDVASQKQYNNCSLVDGARNHKSNDGDLDDIREELECGVDASIPSAPTQHRFSHPMIHRNLEYLDSLCLAFAPAVTPWRRYWLPASMNDPALFYSSVFAAMESIETRSKKQLSPLTYITKGEAIRQINAGLRDPISRISDEIIAAILVLANSECVNGNISALRWHLVGLIEIVKLRGGIKHLGMDGVLMKAMSKFSWFLGTFSHQPPRQTDILYAPSVAFPPRMPTLTELFLLSSRSTHPQVRCPLLARVLQDVYETIVLGYASCSPPLDITTVDQISVSDQVVTAQDITQEYTYYVCNSCETATEIWSRTSERPVPGITRLRQSLKSDLENTDLIKDWLHIPGAHLWCLVVGIYVSQGNKELHTWFVSRLFTFWAPLTLHRWEGLQQALAWFGWILKSERSPVVVR